MELKPLALKNLRSRRRDAETETGDRLSPLMAALRALHSAASPENMTVEELERQRRGQEILGRLSAPAQGMVWEELEIGGMKAAWMRLESSHRRRHAILYCHGGGYTSGNLGYAKVLAAKLCGATGYDVLTFEYRLAPENPYPAAILDGLKAWDYLMQLGYGARDIVVAGDSAGGNMALVLCHRLKAAGRMLPASLLLMSPWTDMTASGESLTQRADMDPMLTPGYIKAVTEAYAGSQPNLTDPSLSPLFGNFAGFPPVLVQVGTHEILYSDSQRLAERLKEAGVDCRLQVWDDMWHVFQMFPIRKAHLAMESISRFLLDIT